MLFIIIFLVGLILLLILFVYSALVVSSECSRIEEKYFDQEELNVKKTKR